MDSEDVARAQVEKAQDAEDAKERLEREHTEMLEEIRVLIPGAEVHVYYVTLLSTASRSSSCSLLPCRTASASGRATRITCSERPTAKP